MTAGHTDQKQGEDTDETSLHVVETSGGHLSFTVDATDRNDARAQFWDAMGNNSEAQVTLPGGVEATIKIDRENIVAFEQPEE